MRLEASFSRAPFTNKASPSAIMPRANRAARKMAASFMLHLTLLKQVTAPARNFPQ